MEGQICGNAPVTWLGEECDGDCAAFVGECVSATKWRS